MTTIDEQFAILKRGVNAWNKWRAENFHVRPALVGRIGRKDLRGVNFQGALLRCVEFGGTDLSLADLSGAELSLSRFIFAKLRGANLRGAQLHTANFFVTDLRETDLREADLRNASLNGVFLHGADLSSALIGYTVFADIDLSTTKGLESVIHYGPSAISIGTIYRSKGNIPEPFLQRCGVPDNFLAFMRFSATQDKAYEFYSCFISFSNEDKHFCNRLNTDLRVNSINTWYFPDDAKWGNSVWDEIDSSIKRYDRLVAVCSKNSLQSGPVLREIERALRREDEERKNILFPITIDDYIFDMWDHPRKSDVLNKVIGDFINCDLNDTKYRDSLYKLIRGLKA